MSITSLEELRLALEHEEQKLMGTVKTWSTYVLYSQTLVQTTIESFRQYTSTQKTRHLVQTVQHACHLLLVLPEYEIDWVVGPAALSKFIKIVEEVKKDLDTVVENGKREQRVNVEMDNVVMGFNQVEMYYELLQVLQIRIILSQKQQVHAPFFPIYKKKQQFHIASALEISNLINTDYVPLVNESILASDAYKRTDGHQAYSPMDQDLLVNIRVNNQSYVIPKLHTDTITNWFATLTAQQWIFSRRDNKGRTENLVREFGSLRRATEKNRECGYFHFLLAMNYQEQKQYSAAIREYKLASEHLTRGHPLLPSAYYRTALYTMLDWNNDPEYTQLLKRDAHNSADNNEDSSSVELRKRVKPIQELYTRGEQAEEDNKYQVKNFLHSLEHSSNFAYSADSSKASVKSKLELKHVDKATLTQLTPMLCKTCQKHSSTPLRRCAACKSTFYCSVQCQRNDWPRHKLECSPSSIGGSE